MPIMPYIMPYSIMCPSLIVCVCTLMKICPLCLSPLPPLLHFFVSLSIPIPVAAAAPECTRLDFLASLRSPGSQLLTSGTGDTFLFMLLLLLLCCGHVVPVVIGNLLFLMSRPLMHQLERHEQ